MKDPWFELKCFTQARIGQGRAGCATTTAAQLDFQLAHAMARDAVRQPWNSENFARSISSEGWSSLSFSSPVNDREQYLLRPDLGRSLAEVDRQFLQSQAHPPVDVVLIVSNGLSSTAVERHGVGLLEAVLFAYNRCSLSIGPICLVPDARVAISDEIGSLLNAEVAVIIVGERPGLSAPDSLGIYLTFAPRPGKTDAERNCLSNIRPPMGLSYAEAAAKLSYLSIQALQRRISGVALKDDMPANWLESLSPK